jgi:prepilin-type N-terminal cleavage/methylation domain-containing protein
MNKRGFTLIELLAVIIILLLLYTIVAPLVKKNMKVAEDYATDAQVTLLEDASYIYTLNYESEIPDLVLNGITTIQVQALLDKGLINEEDLEVNGDKKVEETDNIVITRINDSIYTLYDREQDTSPKIILQGPESIKISKNGEYYEYGAYVVTYSPLSIADISSGGISSNVNIAVEGTYTVQYSYTGAQTISRSVEVSEDYVEVDSEKPVITLNGSATLTISQGSTYTELGASATDNKDGNITSRIVITGSVNTSLKGTYYIKYDVVDLYGNKAITKTRTVVIT